MGLDKTGPRGPRGLKGQTGAQGETGPVSDAYIKKADELQASLDGVYAELRKQTRKVFWNRVFTGAAVLAALLSGQATWQLRQARRHDCTNANKGRAEIKAAFADLYDGFITATGHSQQAVDFKTARMKSLEKGLPQRHCK